ncbi:hypothetical protein GGR88_002168 [Sphingomonas jejuensis]|uniref:DNA primase n=1 Tax=Sphingomonas jejuensis TaxID=904715 RepID=A0ABX0XN32_9SPHN|nr:DNA primase [Sphingomonas jejuensis]NJC34654.1 hypothetical protein [Sphingomonas jejuensis]
MSPRTPLNPENDRDGYDESQRAEVHEYEGGGPGDGIIKTDMTQDRGGDLDEELDGRAPEAPDGFQEMAGASVDDLDDDDLNDEDGDDVLTDGQDEDDSNAL